MLVFLKSVYSFFDETEPNRYQGVTQTVSFEGIYALIECIIYIVI